MLFKKTIALIIAIISVFFVVSLGGCFGGDDETESVTTDSSESSEIIDSESNKEESEESEESSHTEIDTADSSETREESEIFFTVIFDSAGGTKVDSATVKSGEKIPEPPEPKKSNQKQQYVFKGWYIGDSKWDFKNGTVTGNITLTAKWELTGDFTVGF